MNLAEHPAWAPLFESAVDRLESGYYRESRSRYQPVFKLRCPTPKTSHPGTDCIPECPFTQHPAHSLYVGY